MNTYLIKSRLTGSSAVEQFARYYINIFDLDEFYPEVRKCIICGCPDTSKLASDLYDKLLLNELLKIDFLDFLSSLDNEYKVGVLTFNGINAIDDELLVLLKDLGEEKVLKTLCTDEFMDDYLSFN